MLFDRGDEVVVQAGDEGIRFLLVSGKPLEEPVAWYGPIVMNTGRSCAGRTPSCATARSSSSGERVLTVLAFAMLAGGPHPTSELLGHWRGESICVKADWNAACNDEVVFYDVVPGEKPDRVLCTCTRS